MSAKQVLLWGLYGPKVANAKSYTTNATVDGFGKYLLPSRVVLPAGAAYPVDVSCGSRFIMITTCSVSLFVPLLVLKVFRWVFSFVSFFSFFFVLFCLVLIKENEYGGILNKYINSSTTADGSVYAMGEGTRGRLGSSPF
jgi:hypothetical protein